MFDIFCYLHSSNGGPCQLMKQGRRGTLVPGGSGKTFQYLLFNNDMKYVSLCPVNRTLCARTSSTFRKAAHLRRRRNRLSKRIMSRDTSRLTQRARGERSLLALCVFFETIFRASSGYGLLFTCRWRVLFPFKLSLQQGCLFRASVLEERRLTEKWAPQWKRVTSAGCSDR